MDISENGYYVTNELGEIHISGLPLGKYELKEVQELEGYVKNNKVYDIDLSYDHTDKIIYSKELDVLNKKTATEISKVDATTGKEIEGAKLTLKDKETGEVVESWTSGKEPHRIEGLTVSKTYVLHEDLAPAGYNVASDVEFTISDTGEVQKVVMKDEAKPVVVKTGDDSNMSFYIAMGMFALGLIVCFYAKRKYGEKNDK